MALLAKTNIAIQPKGYLTNAERKDTGAHYTPKILSDFLAKQILQFYRNQGLNLNKMELLDPAIGDGSLVDSFIEAALEFGVNDINVTGFDIDSTALERAISRLEKYSAGVTITLKEENYLDHIIKYYGEEDSLFYNTKNIQFDVVITNPPYVRTQVLGATQAQALSKNFDLSGRVDLYQAFLKTFSRVLIPGGLAGIIIPNRFMTTRGGASVRSMIKNEFDVVHIWDLGDSQLFDAAVLPALLLLRKKDHSKYKNNSKLTSIYSYKSDSIKKHLAKHDNLINAIDSTGVIHLKDGKSYKIQQGYLNSGNNSSDVWRLANKATDNWLDIVKEATYCTFGDLGRIRVGVKTTADKVFIRDDWESLPQDTQPEVLRPLLTHHISGQYKSKPEIKKILYTHYFDGGKKKTIDLNQYPKTKKYLELHRPILEQRQYIRDAGRDWFEIWVSQDPQDWQYPKIVFRDISEKPQFWLNEDGAIVNGDCYWVACKNISNMNVFWLALASANSSFMEAFYDRKFNNRLYSGRRRFITQYVEHFPIPDPNTEIAKKIINGAKEIYRNGYEENVTELKSRVDSLIWKAFGLSDEKSGG